MMNSMRQSKFSQRRDLLIIVAVVVIIFGAFFALDLANHGLAWRVMWSLTGEEAPLAQMRGMVEWVGNLTRAQPVTDPYVPIQHTDVNPYGINTFLEQEVEPAKREQQVQMIAEAGFHWLRQQFPWQDIEIEARGDFTDRRHPNTTGIISAWDKYDSIVDLAQQYGLEIQARIDTPPAWTHADPEIGTLAPPDNLDDYVAFLTTFAQRYKGRIHTYQIWNEPNIYPEWGNRPVDPEGYTTMLCAAYNALKAVDPPNVVISAALSPTVALEPNNLNEYVFLQRMYQAGAQRCFDVMATQGYGFFSGPTDQRMRPTTLTFARNLYLRDLMVANGDAAKPIWISEAAWNPVDDPTVPQDIPNLEAFGTVTQDQAARYMPLAYDRAQQEWSWIGVIDYWFFKRADDHERDQPFYYFRMVEPDFTPLPVYDAMKSYIAETTPTLYRGVHQAPAWAIHAHAADSVVAAEGAQFADALQTQSVTFTTSGTDVIMRWQGDSAPTIQIDDQPAEAISSTSSDGWTESLIQQSFAAETHTVQISADAPFLLDGVTVYDRSAAHLTPALMVLGALGILALLGIVVELWKRFF